MVQTSKTTIPISKPILGEEEISAVAEVIRSGWISQGPKVALFEQEFAKFVGSEFACAVSNCTTALHLALLALGVQSGDYVATVSHSFIATANAIRYCGAEPLFIDIDPKTYNMDPHLLEKCLRENSSKKISAILVVHQIGMPCDLKSILEIGKRFNIPVVEDAACAIGSEISLDQGNNWEKIGKPHGVVACFSFHPRKVLSTGEGGMITTNDKELDKKFRLLRQHGMSITDLQRHQSKKVIIETYDILGFNYRMTDMQAAVGIEQLKKLPQFIQSRRKIDGFYRQALKTIEWLLPPIEPDYAKSNWQSYAVRLTSEAPKSQEEIIQILFDNGIMTKPGIMNAHQEEVYRDLNIILPESEKARKEVILLPLHSALKESEVNTICEILGSL